MKKTVISHAVGVVLFAWSCSSFAQLSSNDLQGARPVEPPASRQLNIPEFAQNINLPANGGGIVKLSEVVISGNDAIATSALLEKVGNVNGKEFDMRGLMEIAQTITDFYRSSGYIFAQAYLPPQDVGSGKLNVNVIEGKYGVVKALGADQLDEKSQPFLDYGLKSGDAIASEQLERSLLILDDLPGIKIQPVIRPGNAQGLADLLVKVSEDEREESGSVGFDNVGPRSTGQYRVLGTLNLNNLLQYGDKIVLNGMATDKNMLLGSIDYDAPIGYSGLRGTLGYSHTSYVLGDPFSSLGAHGIADTFSAQIYDPVIRSQATNLYLSVGGQHKNLRDLYDTLGTTDSKHSQAVLLGMRFDHRDRIMGGGMTYGSATMTFGNLSLDSSLSATDLVTAQAAGSFNKFNLDVARIQSVTGDLSLYGRFSGQWASKNLDSSEKFNLGGFYGVRAHPLGEGMGDRGYLGQFELRYAVSTDVTPFVFYDAGHSVSNIHPWDANSASTRTISGYGVGLRSLYQGWSIDMTLAAQEVGGASTSDTLNKNPRFFVMVGTKF